VSSRCPSRAPGCSCEMTQACRARALTSSREASACMAHTINAVTLFIAVLIAGLCVVGIACLYFGLRDASQMDFVGGVLLGASFLLVGAVVFMYFANDDLRFEPDDAASSVSNAPGP
jgi:hypothetical protein